MLCLGILNAWTAYSGYKRTHCDSHCIHSGQLYPEANECDVYTIHYILHNLRYIATGKK